MKAAILVFPGSNCDRDLAVGFREAGFETAMVWHKETTLPDGIDVVGVPGGFSYGDYLRCGAIAARSPIAGALRAHADRGGYVLGPCNGFQILCETGLLPGALIRNAGLKYICDRVALRVETTDSVFTSRYSEDQTIEIPIAHHDGNYVVDDQTLARLRGQDRIAFRYIDAPNGATDDIAGILSENRRVLGLMPHPERACDPAHGGTQGAPMFRGLAQALVAA
ncbi:phosphoribosylformylglycinamidine synthase subunit PurQ [Jannaschia aquimarina]|uniref:Phosphoribosylformylglycinamidine synthase subunit PurQ n=1 Tax=Jannaschia aquimarina TaxID=935700 RepID=A0A0D1D3I2_9RHOB|nr:phosphoribosylformylglycinamidine synthase subunit PurQ [Jannaschia aquimarina]KIT14683.1 Phosphoribosylformylglycinamidine synthase 1 [Jannaschia aquimarina]SNT38110.1 phosphoribosylformylglycinamidine synthase subunit I [Jannaschia aquimarina]